VNVPLITTKLYKPTPRPGLVSRPRLIEKMSAGLNGRLTLISAPAGYGKTTLLAAWLSQLDCSVAWLSLDEGDNEVPRFMDYLIAALQTVVPKIGKAIPTLPGTSGSVPIYSLLSSLINEISITSENILLVLDDYHCITAEEVHQAVLFLLDYLPERVHVIIASRNDPPIKLAQFRALGELCEIRASDLRFTQPESVNFLNLCMSLDLSIEDVKVLIEKTEGWIVGLQLAAISLKEQLDRHAFVTAFAGNDRYVMDYLMDEVLANQTDEIREFLLSTASLDRFCAALCDTVIGWKPGKSQRIIEAVDQANLFVIPLDNRREWYRYHHLFASLLQHRLKAGRQIDVSSIHLKASHWYEQRGQVNDALQQAILAYDPGQISALVKKTNIWVAMGGERTAFVRWVKSQPEAYLLQEPWLSIAAALALTDTGKFDEAEGFLQFAERTVDLDDRARAHIAMVRASQGSMLGDHERMSKYAQEGLRLAGPEDIQLHGMLSFFLSKAAFWTGNLPASETGIMQTYQENLSRGDYDRAILDLSELGSIQAVRNQITKALKTLQKALSLAEKIQRTRSQPTISAAYTHIILTDIYNETGDFEAANYHIREALRLSEIWGQPEIVSNSYISFSRYLQLTGDLDGALDAINKAEMNYKFEGGESGWEDYVISCKARLYLLRGELPEAVRLLDEIELGASDPVRFDKKFPYRILIKVMIEQGDYRNASQLAGSFAEICEQSTAWIHAIKFRILEAKSLYLEGALEGALVPFKMALDRAAEEGMFVIAFIEEGEAVAKLLYQAATRGIHPEFCQKVLDKFTTGVQPMTASTPSLVESLSPRELEVLEQIALGRTNQEIALALHLSLYTVKSHARNIFGKLDVKNRTEAVARARLLGLLPQD
jgi:LuxR family maltose regulon positive regulatory protein